MKLGLCQDAPGVLARSRSRCARALRSALLASFAVACGDEVAGSAGGASCQQLELAAAPHGQTVECACADGTRGESTCDDGVWSACTCAHQERATPESVCGNGVVEYEELCDGDQLKSETCASATLYSLNGGVLRCTADCTLDTSGCTDSGELGSAAGGGAPGLDGHH